MSSRKSKRNPPSQAPTQPAFVGAADRLHPFLERYGLALALLLIVIASVRIVGAYWVFSQTSDEPAHLACGMEWLDHGEYLYEPQHPPLARIASAVGPYLLGARSHPATGFGAMYLDGLQIYHARGRYDDTLAASRAGILPFFWIACGVVYLWTRRDYGPGPAVLALFVFTMLPPVLAHAGLATTDMALTAFLGAAFLTAREWLVRPTRINAVWFGVAGGLALLSKFSSVVFFPAAAVLGLLWYLASNSPPGGVRRGAVERLPTFGIAVGVAALIVWACYRFSFGPVAPGGVPLPAPELFRGIGQVLLHNRLGHPSYLLGEFSPSGFWNFYFVVLAVKTPLPVLLLSAAGAFFAIRSRRERFEGCLPIVLALAVLGVALASRINIGVRHVLPVYLGLSILAAAAAWRLFETAAFRRWAPATVVVLGVWLTAGSVLSHPDYLPYFNELAGSHPENILVDSDLDWGQDIKRLSLRLRQAGAQYVTFKPTFWVDYATELPPRQFSDGQTPYVGWNAVSITNWKLFHFDLPRSGPVRPWPDLIPPQERIGKGMLLWYFPPSSGLPMSKR